MGKFKINKKACLNCGLEAAVARKVCAGCNTPFYSKRPTYYYEVKDGQQQQQQQQQQVDPEIAAGTSTAITSDTFVPPGAATIAAQTSDENVRRRTERVKREKPHFYDASEFENKNKKPKADKNAKVPGKPGKDVHAEVEKREKKRMKEMKMRESMAKAEDENLYRRIMTPHKVEQLAIILEELNHKLLISSWKP